MQTCGLLHQRIKRLAAPHPSNPRSRAKGARAPDTWRLSQHLGQVAGKFPAILASMRQRYLELPQGIPKHLNENVLASRADEATIRMLVRGYAADNRPYGDSLKTAVENLSVGRRPLEGFSGAYELLGQPLVQLRQELFAMTRGEGPQATLAMRCLLTIERARDEHGRPASEPRHPDIGSGFAWPILDPPVPVVPP